MVDGPGIRYVVFFAGCNLRCKYCHNPDTWKLKDGAPYTVGEVLRDIKKYRSYLHFSDGGVTITGGDPFVQPLFLVELLKACKSEGFHTAVDTSGYAPPESVRSVLQYTDLLLLDIKSINPIVYKDVTGVSLEPTLETLRLARKMEVPTWVRFVLVPGLTDDEADLRAMAAFLRGFPNVEKVEVLPYHELGKYKWKELDLVYELDGVRPPTGAELARVRGIFN